MRRKSANDPVEPFETLPEPCPNELEALAGTLMRRARETAIAPADEEKRVLMDVESDGMRCILVLTPTPRTPQRLSHRELEIARLIARGLPNKTIADVLQISAWTVGTYVRRMFAKLHVTSRAAMIAKLREDIEDMAPRE